RIAHENQYGQPARRLVEAWSVSLVFPADRLKHAADAVAEVHAEQRHAHDVKGRHPDVIETDHHHLKNVVAFSGVHEIHEVFSRQIDVLHLSGEMQEMVDDEHENDNPAY